MVIVKDNVKKLRIDKVRCCYFDEVNLQDVDVKDLKITTGPLRLIYIYESRRWKV